MIDFTYFYQLIAQNRLNKWLVTLPKQLDYWTEHHKQNDQINYWIRALDRLPAMTPEVLQLTTHFMASLHMPLSDGDQKALTASLQRFMPWRKGPYHLYGVEVDTEWRSDWKWQRVLPHIKPLKNKLVLDVGCGNGYHLWRMVGEGAKLAVGIDPTALFLFQFEAIRKLIGNDNRAHLLPIGVEQLPELNAFDTVFSMGVLYHRRSPFDHLIQLKKQLVSGGQLLLETLVIEGDEQSVLVPVDRYAKMNNTYFIPSGAALLVWLQKCGFIECKMVDISTTSLEEQRRTAWINTESLIDFLDPNDHTKTIEGYPAPRRATFTATKP